VDLGLSSRLCRITAPADRKGTRFDPQCRAGRGTASHRPALGSTIAQRQDGVSPATVPIVDRADPAVQSLRRPGGPKNVKSVVATAVARELAGHLCARDAPILRRPSAHRIMRF
jgi:hypothetical protein